MQCEKCGTTVQVGDRFCEECGAPLIAETPISSSTGKCEKCGAERDKIDLEGYCSLCGFRNQLRQQDYIEINLQSNLGGVTDPGLRHHRNEDYLTCAKIEGKNAYVLVVCDGVSSSQSPELAAKVAAESACKTLTDAIKKGNFQSDAAMKEAIASAQSSVCAIPYDNPDAETPSTTIIAAIAIDRTATIGWLGDSRAYWISSQGSRQLSKDDSWINDVVSTGQMTEIEARKSPHAHAITRWLGADTKDDSEPSIVKFEIPDSGHLLLCTDGLWNYAPSPTQIAEIVKQMLDKDAVTISRKLVEFARSKGGYDNITVAILSL